MSESMMRPGSPSSDGDTMHNKAVYPSAFAVSAGTMCDRDRPGPHEGLKYRYRFESAPETVARSSHGRSSFDLLSEDIRLPY